MEEDETCVGISPRHWQLEFEVDETATWVPPNHTWSPALGGASADALPTQRRPARRRRIRSSRGARCSMNAPGPPEAPAGGRNCFEGFALEMQGLWHEFEILAAQFWRH